MATSQPQTPAPSSPRPSSFPEAESGGPVPVQAAEVTIRDSPQLFLSLRFLAMVVRALVAARRCQGSRSSAGGRLLAAGSSVPSLGWAQFPQTLRMLLWRWWEGGRGGESG